MTNFPDALRIKVIDRKTKEPVSGIMLTIRLFATHKNDYYISTSLSDEAGEILVTKQEMKEQIDRDRNMYIMDYSSLLEDCKNYIEIKVNGAETQTEKIAIMEQNIEFYPEISQELITAKESSNWKIAERKKIVSITEGAELQEIIFKIKIKKTR